MKWRGVLSIACLGLLVAGAGLVYAQAQMDYLEEGLRIWLIKASPVLVLTGALGISVVGVRLRWLAWIGLLLLVGGLGASWLLTEEFGASMGTTGWVSGLLYISIVAPLGVGLCVTACIISIVSALRRDPGAKGAMAVGAGLCGLLVVALIGFVAMQAGASNLLERLDQAQGDERVEVLYEMTHLQDSDLVAPMIELLKDPDPEVRKVAAMVLQVQSRLAQAVDPLFAAIDQETDSGAKQFMIRALGSAVNDAPARKDEAARVLLAMLHDPDDDIRIVAADTLGWLGHESAIEPLVEMLEDDNSLVVWQAHESLLRLTDQRLGENPEEWRRWLASQ